jgi:DNA invertase Pin-like site-specific DNA recombinase
MQDGRYLGYLRVSTEEQAREGVSLQAQRALIQVAAAARGWTRVDYIEDAGRSGKDTNRPGLELALDLLTAGQAAGLIVSSMDRLSRSLLDFITIMAEAQKQGWALVALDCPVDPTTPTGEAMASMRAVFAQWERRVISQRIREALAVKKANGVRLGRPPAVPVDVVARIQDLRAAGRTYQSIADSLNTDAVPTAHGGQRWYPSTVRYIASCAS